MAVATLSLVCLAGTSSVVSAMDIGHPTTNTAIESMNTLTSSLVPENDAIIAVGAETAVDTALQSDGTASASADAFGSLAEAVAAQDAIAQSDELRCLAGAVYFESKGEPLKGQLAVAQVILNRAASGRFPTDVCGVVKQRGQFSFVRGGEIPAVDATRSAYRTAIAVAKVAMAHAWQDGMSSALFFNATGHRPGPATIRIAAIGNHIFYR